jgi:hypothetical protein
MELVNINLFAEGFYSGSIYEDNIWIKKSSYEKLTDNFPTEIYIGDLDGKYSEVEGNIKIQNYWHTDEEYAKSLSDHENDGDYLKDSLINLYEENGLDWEAEQQEIKEYFDGIDVWKTIEVFILSSKVDKLNKFVKTLINQGNNND